MIDKAFVEQMKTKIHSDSREERTIARTGLILRAGSSVPPTIKMARLISARLSRPKKSPRPPPTTASKPLEPSALLSTPADPPSTKRPPPNHSSFSPPSSPDEVIGYGRYRHYKHAPREEILAHIDSQIGNISDILDNFSQIPDNNIPGYDDVTFGDRLRVKKARELKRALAELQPSEEITPTGTVIQRGFPGAEPLALKAATRKSYDHNPTRGRRQARCGNFNPMARPDKGNSKSWGKVGFTKHPLPEEQSPVPRKWNELEKLRPSLGPEMARKEAAERYRQNRRGVSYGAIAARTRIGGQVAIVNDGKSNECRAPKSILIKHDKKDDDVEVDSDGFASVFTDTTDEEAPTGGIKDTNNKSAKENTSASGTKEPKKAQLSRPSGPAKVASTGGVAKPKGLRVTFDLPRRGI